MLHPPRLRHNASVAAAAALLLLLPLLPLALLPRPLQAAEETAADDEADGPWGLLARGFGLGDLLHKGGNKIEHAVKKPFGVFDGIPVLDQFSRPTDLIEDMLKAEPPPPSPSPPPPSPPPPPFPSPPPPSDQGAAGAAGAAIGVGAGVAAAAGTSGDGCYGRRQDPSSYRCPDTLPPAQTYWLYSRHGDTAVGTFDFAETGLVRQWLTPSPNVGSFVSAELGGAVVAVLRAGGSCNPLGERPASAFFNCAPLASLPAGACGPGARCGPNDDAYYSLSGFDRGHMVASREAALWGAGEASSFSMCNLWPQGRTFNEIYWKHLEFTTSAYAIEHDEAIILTGPLFDGSNRCIAPGANDPDLPQDETPTTQPCGVGATSPFRIPSGFFKVLIDVAARKYWAFAASNDFVTTKQDVQSMFLPDGLASPALRGLPFGLRLAPSFKPGSCCGSWSSLTATTRAADCPPAVRDTASVFAAAKDGVDGDAEGLGWDLSAWVVGWLEPLRNAMP